MNFLLPFDGERRLAMSGSRILAASPTTMSSTATTSWWTEARKISCGCWARYVECTGSSICIPKRWWLLWWANEWKQRATRSLKTWTGTRKECLLFRLGVKSADLNNELKWIKLNEQLEEEPADCSVWPAPNTKTGCNTLLLLWDIPHANVWPRCARKKNRRVNPFVHNYEQKYRGIIFWISGPEIQEQLTQLFQSRVPGFD